MIIAARSTEMADKWPLNRHTFGEKYRIREIYPVLRPGLYRYMSPKDLQRGGKFKMLAEPRM